MGIVQGRGVDSSLNEVGVDQADLFYRNYRGIPFDKIYTSNLRRTKETVSRFIDLGIGHEALPGLDEIHWGSKEGKPFNERDHHEYRNVTRQWQQGNTHIKIAGGESPDDVKIRQRESLEKIMNKQDERTILICMHGRALRIFICLLLDYPLKHMSLFPHNNTGLYRIICTGSYYRVDTINSLRHLNSNGAE